MTIKDVQEMVIRAMDALESDASVDQRRAAWNELRDYYFPGEPWGIDEVEALNARMKESAK